MKKITQWLFRDDLDLKSRWWHRLLTIIFYFSFGIFIIYHIALYSNSNIFRGEVGVQQWKEVSPLSERITSEIKPISAFLKIGEKIAENNRTYVLNNEPDMYYELILNDVYCSSELANNYEKIMNIRQATDLYTGGSFNRNKVSPEEFSYYINQYGIKCLIVDSYSAVADTYSGYIPVAERNSNVIFLNADKSYQDNWYFYEKSTIKTVMYFVGMISIVLAFSLCLFMAVVFFYNKIILYIIFGNKK